MKQGERLSRNSDITNKVHASHLYNVTAIIAMQESMAEGAKEGWGTAMSVASAGVSKAGSTAPASSHEVSGAEEEELVSEEEEGGEEIDEGVEGEGGMSGPVQAKQQPPLQSGKYFHIVDGVEVRARFCGCGGRTHCSSYILRSWMVCAHGTATCIIGYPLGCMVIVTGKLDLLGLGSVNVCAHTAIISRFV